MHLQVKGPWYVATTNAHKVEELQALFGDAIVLRPAPSGYVAPDEVESTYIGNARLKAEALVRQCGVPALADDSGLEVAALDGAPGLHTARWADSAEARLQKLESSLIGVDGDARGARFVCALVAASPDGLFTTVQATVDGRIATTRRGVGGFGYDPLFELPELGRTMAELTATEKNRFSHRARAVRALLVAWSDQG